MDLGGGTSQSVLANEDDWRLDARAWTVVDFFEFLKDQFRQLKFIPLALTPLLVSMCGVATSHKA
jgi:hypothetical protein